MNGGPAPALNGGKLASCVKELLSPIISCPNLCVPLEWYFQFPQKIDTFRQIDISHQKWTPGKLSSADVAAGGGKEYDKRTVDQELMLFIFR